MRATGLQGDASAEIIEIIDDDTDAFGTRVPTTTAYDTGGPRWIGPVAAATLIAIIGWSIATSASENGGPSAAPAPSTSLTGARTTNSVPFTPATVARPLVPYYAADPPISMTVQSASIQEPQDNYYGPSTYQLWAQPGATPDSGSWFSVESYPGSGPGTFAIDAYRVQADNLSIAISRTSARQAVAQFSPAGKASVTMTASGLGDEDIARIAEDIRVVSNIVQFSDRAAVDGYEMLSSEQPWAAVQGIPIEQLFYAAADDPFGGFGITVSQRNPSTGSSDLDRETALRYLLEGGRIFFDVGGNAAVAGEVIGQDDYSLATWTADDHIVTVAGSMPVDQLVAMAQTVHQISPDEWSGVVFQAAGHRGDNNFGNYEQSPPLPVSFGTDSNAEPWKIEVATATFGDRHQVVWQWDSAGFGTTQKDGVAQITSVVDDRRTHVLAELPRSVAATAQFQVLRAGGDPVLVPFVDPDPDVDRTFAAYVFSEPVTFTARIIGSDGAVTRELAVTMKIEVTPEIIEIIDDDTDVFGDRAGHTTMHDTGGPRWVGPAAAIALLAIIGYGIASSASSSSVPKTAPAPSTTVAAPTTTQPAPTTTEVPEQLVPYYAADPPRELTVAEAETFDPDVNYSGPGFYQLWATDDATATSGSWFTAETYSASFSSISATDVYRFQTANHLVTVSHLPGGQASVQFSSGNSIVNLTSFGFTDEALIQLADSISVARSHLQFSDRSLISDFRVLSSVNPYFALQGNAAEQIFYADSTDPMGGFSIVASPRSASAAGSSTLDRQIAARFLLNNRTEFAVDGHVAVAGDVIGQDNVSLAAWVAGDHLVTVIGRMGSAELIAIAETVHEVSPESWAGMQFQATRHTDDNFGSYEQTDPQPVNFGTDSAGEIWTIKASAATFRNQRQLNWEWAGGGNSTRIDDTARITTVADANRTYVLADLPRTVASTAQLQILRDGFEPVLVPFADTDPSFDRTFSAYAFSEPTPYTAQIVGPDGTLIAYWPAP